MRKTKKAKTSKYNALLAEIFIDGKNVNQIKPTELTVPEMLQKLFRITENVAATPEEQELRRELVSRISVTRIKIISGVEIK